jgi:hypothetical protein
MAVESRGTKFVYTDAREAGMWARTDDHDTYANAVGKRPR